MIIIQKVKKCIKNIISHSVLIVEEKPVKS